MIRRPPRSPPFPYTTLSRSGRDELAKIAAALKDIIDDIPAELPWVLQVDGHTDRLPISTARFPSNWEDRKSTRLNSSHANISYAVFCLKKKKSTLDRTHLGV